MKIYTKKGDKGSTSLFGGQKVTKDNQRIHAYGTVDELNSILGQAISGKPAEQVLDILNSLQNQLFTLGSDLATPLSKKTKIDRISESDTSQLETWIDEIEKFLPPLRTFILPGGSESGASLHVARTVCRRAEREVVALDELEEISNHSIIYLNRLSDLLFVLARYENYLKDEPETPWNPSDHS